METRNGKIKKPIEINFGRLLILGGCVAFLNTLPGQEAVTSSQILTGDDDDLQQTRKSSTRQLVASLPEGGAFAASQQSHYDPKPGPADSGGRRAEASGTFSNDTDFGGGGGGLPGHNGLEIDMISLWLEITNAAEERSYLNLHHATNQVYAIWSTHHLAGSWRVEMELWPAMEQTNVLPFSVPNLERQSLFLQAEARTT